MAKKKEEELKFYQKLILTRYIFKQFGVEDFKELSQNMKTLSLEEIDDEGVTGFYKQLSNTLGKEICFHKDKLAEYDLHIVSHLRKINEKRDEKITLKYFQYLSLLFIEYYLDEFFNNKNGLLEGLNEFVNSFNEDYPNDTINEYQESDLNKIALWNATGSGKTLLMHINYHQYLHYAKDTIPDGASYILLTPKEGLSLQHIDDFKLSDIPAKTYDKSESSFFADRKQINILENTKLDKKDGDKKVATSRFGNENIVFVDEGHRGASGDTWYIYRNQLCEKGFSFEYSATFGQAIKASGKNDLMQEYAKCIIFDYSYKYFYNDGYGKDYTILNLQDDSDAHQRELYLTACLLTYYQQKLLYLSENKDIKKFNLENPLFIFVGASVNAVRSERGQKVSDVIDILLFLQNFVSNEKLFTSHIERILSGQTGLLDNKNRDIFRNTFSYLFTKNMNSQEVYGDILTKVFNCNTSGASLHIENLKGVSGEIGLRLGENRHFGVINVGDDTALLNLCLENKFDTKSIDFSDSLFHGIDKGNSPINILIGSKKFTEGWNCWRVSTMGLMNIGKSEGSEIIQLFGRGVRLKGYDMSLKRSNALLKNHTDISPSKDINILETLNVFGVRADYMTQFKEFLEAEGVSPDKEQPIIINLPVIRNKNYKKDTLLTLKVKDNLDFKKNAPKPFLKFADNIHIILDCYAKVQFQTSNKNYSGEITKTEANFKNINLAFLDYDTIFFELQEYKKEKGRFNVHIQKQDIRDLLRNNHWYTLLIPEDDLKVKTFEDYKRFEKIAISLLKKYFDKLYYNKKNEWEKPLLTLTPIDDNDENFLQDDQYTIAINNPDGNSEIIMFIENLKKEVEKAKINNTIHDFSGERYDLEAIVFSSILYNPVLYLAKKNIEINISPVALNESEGKFIKDLKEFCNENLANFDNRELYIIRNKSKKGVGFFENSGFYPDFIMWIIDNEKQHIVFIEPHGMRNTAFTDEKVELFSKIKEVEKELNNSNVTLESFILSSTKYVDLSDKTYSEADWNDKHVFFMEDEKYLQKIFDVVR